MIGLELRFLAGRFHANSWHHAHNEGVPEWPPSPWRVLRALVSAAYAEDIPPERVEPLLEKLRELPRYRLPLAVDGHTRHYMPDVSDANHKKAKVFDVFVAVAGGAARPEPVTIAWPTSLSSEERELLARLCRRVSYLGRAESWTEVTVVDVEGEQWTCWPDERDARAGATTLMALEPVQDFDRWSQAQPKPKKGADIPRRLWDVLTFDGDRYRDEGWSSVPGTRLVRYVFEEPPFRRAVVPSPTAFRARRPTVARYAIRSAVLPRIEEALAIGERLRVSVMSQSRRVSGDVRVVFSGHGSGSSDHRHAMYLATCDDPQNFSRGFIDHLVVAAKAGFDEEDVVALQRLRRVWGRGGHDLELILVGLGQPEDFGGAALPQAPILATSSTWESATPFVPVRHPKTARGVARDTIEEQLRRGCEQLVGVAPIAVALVGEDAKWARFRRRRLQGNGRRGPDRAHGARLTFASPVQGPIALGYGAHFGLGLFRPVRT